MGPRTQAIRDGAKAFGRRLLNVFRHATSVRSAATAWVTGVSAAGQHGGWHEAKPIAIWVGVIVIYQICEKLLDDDCQPPQSQEPPKP